MRGMLWSAFAAFAVCFANAASPAYAATAATAGVRRSSPASHRAEADGTEQHLGRTITDVRVEIAGLAVADANVLNLIETRVGEPLAAHSVRNTIDHLVGLGRFEDVRVVTAPSDQGVALRWHLTPVRRISKITVTGSAVLPASDIRAELADRHGGLPSTNRVNDMVATLQAYYGDRGFPNATILPRVQEEDPVPERVELVLSIAAGNRVTIGAATVTGMPLEPPSDVLTAPNLHVGRPYDRPAIDARISDYEESLRERGYYEARVTHTATFTPSGAATVRSAGPPPCPPGEHAPAGLRHLTRRPPAAPDKDAEHHAPVGRGTGSS